MATQTKVKAQSPAQVKANKAFAAAGRSAQAASRAASKASGKAAKPRSAAQIAATAKWQKAGAMAAHAAAVARKAGKAYAPKKKAAAPQPDLGVPGEGPTENVCNLYLQPACGPAALRDHLLLSTGIWAPDESVLALHFSSGLLTLADLLEYTAVEGFPAGGGKIARLDTWTKCDPGLIVPGLLVGVQLRHGYHAAVAVTGGMTSWGGIWPRDGSPEEAWHLTWGLP